MRELIEVLEEIVNVPDNPEMRIKEIMPDNGLVLFAHTRSR